MVFQGIALRGRFFHFECSCELVPSVAPGMGTGSTQGLSVGERRPFDHWPRNAAAIFSKSARHSEEDRDLVRP